MLKNRSEGFGRKWGKLTHWIKVYKRGSHRGGMEGGRGWLDSLSGMNELITIRGIKKMYESVNMKFNLDTNGGRFVESGSGRIRRGPDLGKYMWLRFKESVDPVFTNFEFPHR